MKEWLSTKEAANLLHVHPDTLRKWRRNGKFDSRVKIEYLDSGAARYLREDLLQYKSNEHPVLEHVLKQPPSVEQPTDIEYELSNWDSRTSSGMAKIVLTACGVAIIAFLAILIFYASIKSSSDKGSFSFPVNLHSDLKENHKGSDFIVLYRDGKTLRAEDMDTDKTLYKDTLRSNGSAQATIEEMKEDVSGLSQVYEKDGVKYSCSPWKRSKGKMLLCVDESFLGSPHNLYILRV